MLAFHHDGKVDENINEPAEFQRDVNIRIPGSKITFPLCLKVLRRLTIIAAEDVSLAEDLPKIVWLMAATACGYNMREEDNIFILSFVEQLANFPTKTKFHDPKLAPTVDTIRTLSPLAFSLVIRAAYGGMPCDVELMLKAARMEAAVTKIPAVTPRRDERFIILLEKDDLLREHRLLSAVDFHVSDILSVMPNSMDPDDAKSAMWKYWSGVNVRNGVPHIPDWWQALEPELQRFASKEWDRKPWINPNKKENTAANPKKRGRDSKQPSILRYVKVIPAGEKKVKENPVEID